MRRWGGGARSPRSERGTAPTTAGGERSTLQPYHSEEFDEEEEEAVVRCGPDGDGVIGTPGRYCNTPVSTQSFPVLSG